MFLKVVSLLKICRRKLVCHAEAGTAGELPGSETPATKEISAFEKFIELLTTMFPIWVMSLHLLIQSGPPNTSSVQMSLLSLCLCFFVFLPKIANLVCYNIALCSRFSSTAGDVAAF